MYAELEEYEPKIWRRFQFMNDITVAKLAYILMTLFEMKGSHLYKFEVNERENGRINHEGQYNEFLKDEEDFFEIGQYGCIFEDDNIIPEFNKNYRELEDAKDIKLKHVL